MGELRKRMDRSQQANSMNHQPALTDRSSDGSPSKDQRKKNSFDLQYISSAQSRLLESFSQQNYQVWKHMQLVVTGNE
jgi:hypothetical protein